MAGAAARLDGCPGPNPLHRRSTRDGGDAVCCEFAGPHDGSDFAIAERDAAG